MAKKVSIGNLYITPTGSVNHCKHGLERSCSHSSLVRFSWCPAGLLLGVPSLWASWFHQESGGPPPFQPLPVAVLAAFSGNDRRRRRCYCNRSIRATGPILRADRHHHNSPHLDEPGLGWINWGLSKLDLLLKSQKGIGNVMRTSTGNPDEKFSPCNALASARMRNCLNMSKTRNTMKHRETLWNIWNTMKHNLLRTARTQLGQALRGEERCALFHQRVDSEEGTLPLQQCGNCKPWPTQQ